MALFDDLLKGNAMTGLAVGAAAMILGPTLFPAIGRVLRPAAKAVIKGGMVLYRETVAEVGELASDLIAEARAEIAHNGASGEAAKVPAPSGRGAHAERH